MHRWCPQGPWHPSSDGWWSWAEQHLRCPRHRWRGFAESQRWALAWFTQPTSCLSAALEKSPSTRWKVTGIFVKKRFYLFRSCSSSETAGVGNQSPSHHPEKQHQRQRGSKQPGVDLVFYLYSVFFFYPVAQCVKCLLRGCCRRMWWKSRRSAAWAARPAAARAPRRCERLKTWRATSWKHKRRLLPSWWEKPHTLPISNMNMHVLGLECLS